MDIQLGDSPYYSMIRDMAASTCSSFVITTNITTQTRHGGTQQVHRIQNSVSSLAI